MKNKGSLETVLESITSFATEKRVIIFNGLINHEDRITTIVCNYKNETDLLSFFELAALNKAHCLIFETYSLSEDEIERALEVLEDEDLDIDKSEDELKKELKLAQKDPERISYINLQFLASNELTIYSLEILSETHRFVSELNDYDDDDNFADDSEEDSDDEFEDDDEDNFFEGDEDNAEKMNNFSVALANLENFSEAVKSNDNALLLLDRIILADEASTGQKSNLRFYEREFIRRKAKAIYETDILPGLEIKLREKAQTFLNEGMKKSEVAATLGMTLPKLNKLLSQY